MQAVRCLSDYFNYDYLYTFRICEVIDNQGNLSEYPQGIFADDLETAVCKLKSWLRNNDKYCVEWSLDSKLTTFDLL
jgi:hypothetical protein